MHHGMRNVEDLEAASELNVSALCNGRVKRIDQRRTLANAVRRCKEGRTRCCKPGDKSVPPCCVDTALVAGQSPQCCFVARKPFEKFGKVSSIVANRIGEIGRLST